MSNLYLFSNFKTFRNSSDNTEQQDPPPVSKNQKRKLSRAQRRAAKAAALLLEAKLHTVIPLPEEPPVLDLTDDTAPDILMNPNQDHTVPPGPSSSGTQQGFHSEQGNNDQPGSTGQNKCPIARPQGSIIELNTLRKKKLRDGWTPEQIKKWADFHERMISAQKEEYTKKRAENIEKQRLQCKKKNKQPVEPPPPTYSKIYRRYNIHPTEYFTCPIEDLRKYRDKLAFMSRNRLNAYKTEDLQLYTLVQAICEERIEDEENESKASNIVMDKSNSPTPGQQNNKKTKPSSATRSNVVLLTGSQSNRPTPAQALMNERPSQPPEKMHQPYTQIQWTSPIDYPKGIPRSFLLNNPLYAQGQQDMNSQNLGMSGPTFAPTFTKSVSPFANDQLFVQTNYPTVESGTYSPTEAARDHYLIDEELQEHDGSESPTTGQKRLSAFQRLGPVTQSKKPKLTINLLFSKEQNVREVLDENTEVVKKPEEHVPVHKRQDILTSVDDTVIRYLPHWPWKGTVGVKRTAMPRSSKSSMMMEQEAMNEGYETNNTFIKIQVREFPDHYKKEDVLDLMLDQLKGKSLIPCFTEFTPEECTFLVLRSRAALTAFHKMGLYIRKESENVNLPMKISITDLTVNKLDFIPRLILRNRLRMAYDGEKKLDLTAFCLQSDISHFIYYPLNNASNQFDLVHIQSAVSWDHLIELNLSQNRLKTVRDFELVKYTPKLKHLDLSHNLLDGMSSTLLPLKGLHLRSLILEGNPLCMDYVDTQHYIGVAKLIFPSLVEIDGVNIPRKGELPKIRRNYCPEEAKDVIERFLEVFFPLLESEPEDRAAMEDLYHEDATLSLTFCHKLRYNPVYRYFRNLFNRARVIDEDNNDCIEGAANIAKHFSRWPSLKHDPYTFYVDVLHHSDSTTIFRISGVLKLTSDSLADDEHLIYFTRSLVLRTNNGAQYRIHNEVLNWDETIPDCANKAFQVTTVKSKKVSLKLDSAPDDDLKEKFIAIFMKLTEMDRRKSERCLEMRNWDLRNALDYFIKLCKLNSIATLEVADP